MLRHEFKNKILSVIPSLQFHQAGKMIHLLTIIQF